MAARLVQSRILSFLTTTATTTRHPPSFLSREPSLYGLKTATSVSFRDEPVLRRFQTFAEASKEAVKEQEGIEKCPAKPNNNSSEAISDTLSQTAIEAKVMSSLKVSPRHDVAMFFTCKVCETRSVKTICRESYEKGVVVARCGGCNNLHLIADRLGWFGEPGSVEEFLALQGEEVKKASVDSLSLTLEDLAGKKNLKP